MEEIIRELFHKIIENLSEKDNENKLLNQKINLYMKQIDENVKKSNFTSKPYTSRNNMASSVSYNEYNTLKLKLINQQKTSILFSLKKSINFLLSGSILSLSFLYKLNLLKNLASNKS